MARLERYVRESSQSEEESVDPRDKIFQLEDMASNTAILREQVKKSARCGVCVCEHCKKLIEALETFTYEAGKACASLEAYVDGMHISNLNHELEAGDVDFSQFTTIYASLMQRAEVHLEDTHAAQQAENPQAEKNADEEMEATKPAGNKVRAFKAIQVEDPDYWACGAGWE
jgi:hypothetical protein